MAWSDVESQLLELKRSIDRDGSKKIVNDFKALLVLLATPENFNTIPEDFILHESICENRLPALAAACAEVEPFDSSDANKVALLFPNYERRVSQYPSIEIESDADESVFPELSRFQLFALILRLTQRNISLTIYEHPAAPAIFAPALRHAAQGKTLISVSLYGIEKCKKSLIKALCELRQANAENTVMLQSIMFDNKSAAIFGAYLSKNPEQASLDLSRSDLDDNDLTSILKGLTSNKNLTILNIEKNRFTLNKHHVRILMLNFSIQVLKYDQENTPEEIRNEIDAILERNKDISKGLSPAETKTKTQHEAYENLWGVFKTWNKDREERNIITDDLISTASQRRATFSPVNPRRTTVAK